MGLVEDLVDAYGGLERWRELGQVIVVFSAGGAALAAKLRPAGLRSVGAMVATAGPPRVVFEGYPAMGSRGEVAGGQARILDVATGRVVRQRPAPPDLGDLRAARRWDDLDLLRVAGAAAWTWVSVPFVLADPAVVVTEGGPWSEGGERWHRLEVTLPGTWPASGHHHVLFVDDELRIRRHDYELPAAGSGLAVAEYGRGYCDIEGFTVATTRRAYLRRADGRRRRGPPVLWVDVILAFMGGHGGPPQDSHGGPPQGSQGGSSPGGGG